MPLEFENFMERLVLMTDAELLCDILGITSEDIIERFEDKIVDHMSVLRDTFDLDLEEQED